MYLLKLSTYIRQGFTPEQIDLRHFEHNCLVINLTPCNRWQPVYIKPFLYIASDYSPVTAK